jgi:drug/metabolite transporter (DMT)-like permease
MEPLIFALISPVLYGFMNIIDKFLLSHKVKSALGFSAVAGIVNLMFGLIIGSFLNWKDIPYSFFIWPILAGIFLGVQTFFYYYSLKETDASYLIGFVYTYPIFVGILSYIFLKESIAPAAYVGILFTLIGVILLTVRARKISLKVGIFSVLSVIILSALSEFFVKVSTENLSVWHGVSLDMIALGLVLTSGLLLRKIRSDFKGEIKNFKFAIFNELFLLFAALTTYIAMQGLPALIVSSISSLQPLSVILFEKIFHVKFGKITQDTRLIPKLGAILLILFGILFIYLSQP